MEIPNQGKWVTRRRQLKLSAIRPHPNNPYNTRTDLEIDRIVRSFEELGFIENFFVTKDGYILSGNSRYQAALIVAQGNPDFLVPCEIYPWTWAEFNERADKHAIAHNWGQREKSFEEKVREAAIFYSDPSGLRKLERLKKKQRAEQAKFSPDVKPIRLEDKKARRKISPNEKEFLDAVLAILDELKDELPVTLRMLHYNMLNRRVMRNISNPNSLYINTEQSYSALSNLVTRARVEGIIPLSWIADHTRPMELPDTWDGADFIRDKLANGLLSEFRPNLQKSQRDCFVVTVEKNSIWTFLWRTVKLQYGIPILSQRGFESVSARARLDTAFQKSKKERLVVIALSDFDPSGEWICDCLTRYMRDDEIFSYGDRIVAYKCCLTLPQIKKYKPREQAEDESISPERRQQRKDQNTHRVKFVRMYGEDQKYYELEALPPAEIRSIVREYIEKLIDMKAFRQDQQEADRDLRRMDAVDDRLKESLKDFDWDRDTGFVK